MSLKPAGWLIPLLLGLSLQASAEAGAEKDVRGWLTEMAQAVKTLNYQGNFVYLHDRNLELMRVVHTFDGSGEKERLISLNGAAREVVRDDASVTCIAPDAKSILINGRKPSAGLVLITGAESESLSDNYEFHLLNRARIAGRPTQVVVILPRDRFRYGYRIFLDQDTALPLKTDMLDTDGAIVSQMMFTSIQIDPAENTPVTHNLEGSEDYSLEQPRPTRLIQVTEDNGWVFHGLPRGFNVNLKARIPAGSEQDSPIEHFLLADGLASVSVYVEAANDGEGLVGDSQMGAVNAFGRQLDGYQVTAVGSVPAITVEGVAKALQRTRAQ